MRWVADEDKGRIEYAYRILSEASTEGQRRTAAGQLAMVLDSMAALQQEKPLPEPRYAKGEK